MEINENIFEVNKYYKIVYDDKGFKPIMKHVLIISKDFNLLKVKSDYGTEILNTINIIRAEELRKDGRSD